MQNILFIVLDTCNVIGYNIDMIKSFKHKGLQRFYETGSVKGIQAIHAEKLSRILLALNNAQFIEDLNMPSYRLHKLKGDMNELWSITVQANWRITFKFEDKNIYIVDYQDYH